jgi:hypothetical protein
MGAGSAGYCPPSASPSHIVMLNSTNMSAERDQLPDEPPPFLGSWKNVYIAVLIYLVVIIVSFYVFMRAFA